MKLLVLDIETAPMLVHSWGLFNQFHTIDQIDKPDKVLSYAAKWTGSKEIKFARYDQTHFLTSIHALLDEADAVITYNGKRFDIPHLNREFILKGLAPPSPYKQIDVYETIKKAFKWPSNKLDYVSQALNVGKKAEHEGFPLWLKVMKGDEKAWARMKKYNIQDIVLLEKLYNIVRPWVANHPNHNLYGAVNVCPSCGSKHVQKRGTYKTQTGIYQRLQCQKCFAWSRTRYTEIKKEDAKKIYTGVALH